MEELTSSMAGTFALPRPRDVMARVLAAATAESITVPGGATFVVLSGTDDFYADFTKTAVTPAADIADGTSPILVPRGYKEIRELSGAATISVICEDACIVFAEFYS